MKIIEECNTGMTAVGELFSSGEYFYKRFYRSIVFWPNPLVETGRNVATLKKSASLSDKLAIDNTPDIQYKTSIASVPVIIVRTYRMPPDLVIHPNSYDAYIFTDFAPQPLKNLNDESVIPVVPIKICSGPHANVHGNSTENPKVLLFAGPPRCKWVSTTRDNVFF